MEKMNQNDRDLLVRLDTKLDSLGKELSEIKGMMLAHDSRIREVELEQSHNKGTIETLKQEVEKLRTRGNTNDIIIAIGTVLVGILSFVK
ncbi:MAG: hypothetical protein HRF47_12260 [Chloroflexota bacterium]|jgi:chromosome segregation ATPase